jgi:hypothetical protein
MRQQNNKAPDERSTQEQGETITELARRHAQDPTHQTTDEELKNARIEFTTVDGEEDENLHDVDDNTVIPAIPGEPRIEEESDDDDDDTSKPPNPYDVLNG